MFHVKIPIFARILILFILPILACAAIKPSTPTLLPTPKQTLISLTKVTKRISLILTRSARRTLNAPTITHTPTVQIPVPARSSKNTATPSPTAAQAQQIDDITIPAPALSNNLLGESTERNLLIYLPASYAKSEKQHYPVVYYLLDFGLTAIDVTVSPEAIQKDIDLGFTKEMITVFISDSNSLGGSFYVNSPVTGNWDDFVAQDVVGYVDAHYRTLPQSTSRGISGYAVGGFGALSVAMRHPDVFGAVYSMSPTLFDGDGLAASPMFSAQRSIDAVLELQVRELPLSVNDGISAMQHAGAAQFSVAYGTSFAPDPQGKPPYMDYPYYRQNGIVSRDETIWQRWQAGLGNIPDKIQQYKENLKKLNGITLVCGENAAYIWMLQGCKTFAAQLTTANITNQSLAFPGGIEPGLEQGLRGFVLPFFTEKLVFEP